MPDIAFFSNHFAIQGGTGITRYVRELFSSMSTLDSPYTITPVASWSNQKNGALATLKSATGLQILPTGRRLTPLLWLTLGLPRLEHLLNTSVDLVHSGHLGYLPATSRPTVITVHDIGPLIMPHYFANGAPWRLKKHLKKATHGSAHFIAVSQSTADTLLDYVQTQFRIDLSARIHVIHEGISSRLLDAPDPAHLPTNASFDFSQPFILAVGKISPRKNLQAVISAMSKLRDTIPHHLVTVGGNGWDFQQVKQLVSSLGISDRVHFLGYVHDKTLNALYDHAALFVYPSLFEGFGLPVLEAMASGCPVITSNISSLPEVAGDAALLVNPHDIDEIAAALHTLCTDHALATRLRQKGRERAKTFSWLNAARETFKIYDQLLN